MERRKFIKSAGIAATGALAGAIVTPDPGRAQDDPPADPSGRPPNILFVLVDELRFPSVFPAGVDNVDGFLARFMPNLFSLWQQGVKFGRHYTAASACTPARGVLITGLYSQQSWLCATLTNQPGQRSVTPILNPAYPTYGKLLRRAGYQTPYVGKWHVSFDLHQLEPYGFDGMIEPDPVGFNLQGSVGQEPNFPNDQDISNRAVQWLSARSPSEQPWCLSVSFVNPHDQQFFWAGTEFQTYNNLFGSGPLQPAMMYSTPTNPPLVSWDDDPLKSPPSFGYPALPPNWESAATLAANKPSTQVFGRQFQGAIWGDVAQSSDQSDFTVQPYPTQDGSLGVGVAPYSYWQRALDSYTNVMTIVDQRIGEVLGALPADVAQNTVIVFCSDHGEYAGAHGFVAGKLLSCYEEPYHVPLIVFDPTGRFTGDTQTLRMGLTSSADFAPLIVSLGHNGSRDWIRGPLARIYGNRHDMLPMLRSAAAPGRPYVLLATDELVPAELNPGNASIHIVGLRTDTAKLGTYASWAPLSTRIEP
ncbi:MAG: hypothetical protein QOG25_2090, partial [Acetobacteraceae bacterium]|nr:hypothetical protein [Acetobacteraceae bacterium]